MSRRAPTDREPLPGGETGNLDLLAREIEEEGLSRETTAYLVRLYGTEAPAVARLARSHPELAQSIVPGHPAIRAQLVHSIRREMALTLADLLMRRTHLFHEVRGQAVAAAPALADLVGHELGWDAPRRSLEVAAYVAEVERHNAFRIGLEGAS